jgi:hypothetical protein
MHSSVPYAPTLYKAWDTVDVSGEAGRLTERQNALKESQYRDTPVPRVCGRSTANRFSGLGILAAAFPEKPDAPPGNHRC